MKDCLFCKILNGEVPGDVVYEDLDTFAFLDITPVNFGHTLVIPKKHAKDIFNISKESWGAVMETVRKLAPVIKKATKADGINIAVNNEPSAGQVIFHSHIHIIPRHKNDGYELWHGKAYKDGEAKGVADKIRNLL